MNKNKHLTLENRKTIDSAIRNNSSKTAIAKEIRLHRYKKRNNTSFFYSNCALLKQCGCCDHYRSKYIASVCKHRDRSPGACNGCTKISYCHVTPHFLIQEWASITLPLNGN